MRLLALALFAAAPLLAQGEPPKPPNPPAPKPTRPTVGDLNPIILEVLATYPTDGSYGYHWPRGKKVTWPGNARDMRYQGKLLAKGDPKHRSFCCGLTFEVWFAACRSWYHKHKTPFALPGFDGLTKLRSLRHQWFGSDGDRRCSDHALAGNQIGRRIARLEDAQAGDFVQFWRHKGSGHSAIFIAWVWEKKAIVGLRYWSTQKSTRGIGYRVEKFGKTTGVDRKQVYLTRAGWEPTPKAKPAAGR